MHEIFFIKKTNTHNLCHVYSFFSPTCFFTTTLVAAYPEINHPVVQLGVLVDCGSAFLRGKQNTITSPKIPRLKYSMI